jgi:phage shock protein C
LPDRKTPKWNFFWLFRVLLGKKQSRSTEWGESMICQSCQKDIAAGSKFCYACGAKQPETQSQAAPSGYAPPYAQQRRLVRSTNDRKVAGVCAGIADYFDFDPSIVRIIWVLAVLVGGSGVLVYVILWIALPEGVTRVYPYSATSSI